MNASDVSKSVVGKSVTFNGDKVGTISETFTSEGVVGVKVKTTDSEGKEKVYLFSDKVKDAKSIGKDFENTLCKVELN